MNYYKRAIEIVFSGDAEKILAAILATNPGAIVRAVDGPVIQKEKRQMTALERRCAELYRSGERVAAIKLWRTETGANLKDAKDAVESLAKGETDV